MEQFSPRQHIVNVPVEIRPLIINGRECCPYCRSPWQFDEAFHKVDSVPDCACQPEREPNPCNHGTLRLWFTFDPYQHFALWAVKPRMGAHGQYIADTTPIFTTLTGGAGARWFIGMFIPGVSTKTNFCRPVSFRLPSDSIHLGEHIPT